MPKPKYETIKDLPDELRLPLYDKPYKRIQEEKLSFSLGYPHWDLMMALVVFCGFSNLFLGHPYGKEHFFLPLLAGAAVYIVSSVRHKQFNKKQSEKWNQYCQGYIE